MTRPEQQQLTRMVELLSEFYDSAREYWSETGHPGDLRHFDDVYTDALSEAESLNVRVAHLEEALRKTDSDLSYLRHRGGINWQRHPDGTREDIDRQIGQNRALLSVAPAPAEQEQGAKN